MRAAISLAEFTAAHTPPALAATRRAALIDQAITALAHTGAVHRLRALRSAVGHTRHRLDDPAFHRAMADIHRAAGRTYLLPEPYASRFAYLPFRIERTAASHYLVTAVLAGHTTLRPGDEITHWNGAPIAWAVARAAAQAPPSPAPASPAAHLARGLDCLPLRPLLTWPPPEQHTVALTRLGTHGVTHESWRVGETPAPATRREDIDLDADARARARKLLFRPDIVALEGGRTATRLATPVAVDAADMPTHLPGVLRARVVHTAHGHVGHLRLYTTHVADPAALRAEIRRLLRLLPPPPVLDIRGACVQASPGIDIPHVLITDTHAEDLLTRADLLGGNTDLIARATQANTGTNATANTP